MRVLVTGANGFVGHALLVRAASEKSMLWRGSVRRNAANLPGVEIVQVGDLNHATDWSAALKGVDAVVHLAARVHVMRDDGLQSLAAFREVNVVATERLARAAVVHGVKRIVYVSSIKVNGEGTHLGRPYTADDVPAPVDPYGKSKYEAEQVLHNLASETGLGVVVIRPVLVYGPAVKGNFLSLMGWLRRGIPLPFGSISNLRSLVALDNLVDLILTCLTHPKAPGETFLVSDDEDISTSALLRRTAAALGSSARLIPVPMQLLQTGARLLGKDQLADRLCGSLQVDIRKTRELLGWVPKVTMDTALKQTARHFLANL